MQKFTTLTSRIAPLLRDDIDTDQIIPARFLKATGKAGLGTHLFAGWRYTNDGNTNAGFILNRPEAAGAKILLAGRNFGCGSSREHAPWALMDFGFRAVIALSFADIFKGNALKNGLLPVAVLPEVHDALRALGTGDEVTVDIAAQTLTLPGGLTAGFPLDRFARTCLLEGVDELDYLRKFEPEIARYEKARAGADQT